MENSKIEWTDHTFNAWQGCIKVSPGCENCYALTLSNRWGKDIWGPGEKRERTSWSYWQKPFAWNKKAEKEGRRYRVFCASMADVFEDNPQLLDWRSDLWDLIELTPNLDWLLLTKRPENVSKFTKRWETWEQLPSNIWIGTSIENQEYADRRIPELLKIPARVHFLSCEPLVGPLNLMKYLPFGAHKWQHGINWVIVGGESSPRARPMHPTWAHKIRDDCQKEDVPFFFKQWGEWLPCDEANGHQVCRVDPDGEWRTDDGYQAIAHNSILRDKGWYLMARVGKHNAGRLLDGVEWSEFPTP